MLKKIINASSYLSLGISMVVAVFLGLGLGIWIKNLTGYIFFIYIGLIIGIAASILNVYKIYKKEIKDLNATQKEDKEN